MRSVDALRAPPTRRGTSLPADQGWRIGRNELTGHGLNLPFSCVAFEVAFMSWDLRFHEPIETPRGGRLVTLRDAAAYVTALPAHTHAEAVWQTAIDCLLLAADKGGPIEFARLAMHKALCPKPAPVYTIR